MDEDEQSFQRSLAVFGLSEEQLQRKSSEKDSTSAVRKDAITELEKSLYVEAVEKHGNNWKAIFHYIFENGRSLPQAVYSKYTAAKGDKAKMKSVRSRLANIGRKLKDRPEVKGREEVNVMKTSQCSTVQEIAVMMQHAKQKEARDPIINHNNSDDAGIETSTPFIPSDASSHEDVPDQISEVKAEEVPRGQAKREARKKRIQSAKKTKLDSLMDQASKMMEVAGKAARSHHSYIKAVAESQDIYISDSD